MSADLQQQLPTSLLYYQSDVHSLTTALYLASFYKTIHSFNGLFQENLGKLASERYKTIWDFNEARDDRVAVATAGLLDQMQMICTLFQTVIEPRQDLITQLFIIFTGQDAKSTVSKH